MSPELAEKRLDYWMRELGLYDFSECYAAARKEPRLRAVLRALGYNVQRASVPRRDRRRDVGEYIQASDCWSPSYRDGMVSVRWHHKEKRISVWGADDFGMEKLGASREEYDDIIASAPLSQNMLRKRGFISA